MKSPLPLSEPGVRDGVHDLLKRFGAEVFGFLLGVVPGPRARDVYARVCERVQGEIRSLGGVFTQRTWLYWLARSELALHRSRIGDHASVDSGPTSLREPTTTMPARRIGRSAAIAALRRRLVPSDREILILRFDRGFTWRDIAVSALGAGATVDELRAEARRVHDRVVEIREGIARAVLEEGLFSPR